MTTTVLIVRKQLKVSAFILALTVISLGIKAQVASSTNGLTFQDPSNYYGTPLQPGSQYLFADVANNTDAIVTLDSLVNGAALESIDDNSNGVGYKQAFQPRIQAGGNAGSSYAVFTIRFYIKNTNTPRVLQTVNTTALDLDGNSALKEFARINVGNGGTTAYMMATPDISVAQISSGDFIGQNTLGQERNGIDTASLANMFTATNTNISSFTIKYGMITTNPSSVVRQFSLYLKGFNYPNAPLPAKVIYFTATLGAAKKAAIKWTTASEINVSHFVLERSFDGANYTEAGTIFAYGSASDKADYSFNDNLSAISAAVVYYRLRTVDNDGKQQYSATRLLQLKNEITSTLAITAYPNPVANDLQITIPANWQNKEVVYEIYAMNGKLVSKRQTAGSSQTETINMANLQSGLYFVKAICGNEMAQQKIVKQ